MTIENNNNNNGNNHDNNRANDCYGEALATRHERTNNFTRAMNAPNNNNNHRNQNINSTNNSISTSTSTNTTTHNNNNKNHNNNNNKNRKRSNSLSSEDWTLISLLEQCDINENHNGTTTTTTTTATSTLTALPNREEKNMSTDSMSRNKCTQQQSAWSQQLFALLPPHIRAQKFNNNNNNNNNNSNSTASASGYALACSWRYCVLKRKQICAFFGILLLLLCLHYTRVRDEMPVARIPVIHYSHVPGMKVIMVDMIATTNQPQSQTQSQSQPSPCHATPLSASEMPCPPSPEARSTELASIAASNFSFAIEDGATLNNSQTKEHVFVASHDDNIENSFSYSSSSPLSNAAISTTLMLTPTLTPPPTGYLVWSERCKMPSIDPYLPEVMIYFRREKYKPCSQTAPLTTATYNASTQRYVLRVDEQQIKAYTKVKSVSCCYQSIERNATGIKADKDISLSECMSFYKSTKLAPTIDNILVKCNAKGKTIYTNGHPTIPERPEVRRRLDDWKQRDQTHNQKATSVLMIGIDSISRVNLIRAMPKTAQYLYDNEWFELSGYNKIDDNTFPNLMAVLTGRNKTNALGKCPPTVLNGLDNCSIIWNTFRDHGYVTAYGEDEADINTFNYLKLGFERPPVDYYLRPFLLGAEKHLTIKRKSSMIYCLGYKHSAEFVYDYALEFASRYRNDSYFGLFWTNSFSHNAISDCTSMDERMVEYLERFAALGTLNNTIVVFFSDHGIRFGPTRKTHSGHLEERLPFIFLWIPPHLKQSHPEFVNALNVNKNRLTNPYDLHMTLKHVLRLSGRVENETLLRPAEDCPRCQSLLMPVPHNRSCDEVAIADHWCTCIPYQNVYKNSKVVQEVARATVTYINDYVANFRNGSFAKLCVPLKFGNVESAYRAQHFNDNINGAGGGGINSSVETYRIIFHTKPNKALFEATVRYNTRTNDMQVTGEISRLNSYNTDSDCVGDGGAKKYCSCHKKLI